MRPAETKIRAGMADKLCHILSIPIKRWFAITALALVSAALCAVVLSG